MTSNRICEYFYRWDKFRFVKGATIGSVADDTARQDAFADMADDGQATAGYVCQDDDCDQDFAFPVCDYAEMRGAVMSAVQRVGRARVFAILLEITGVEDLSLIPAEQYGEVYDAMQFLDSNP